ncbi:MAG: hypothetical protein WCI03_14970 [bacterium]
MESDVADIWDGSMEGGWTSGTNGAELMRDDKRDQETAAQVRTELIRQIRNIP